MSYKVSVVMPSYNAGKFLDQSINSIINQTLGFENIEVIIVDDGSEDNTKDILENYSKKYENIKCIILSQNSGPSHARNLGIKNVTSDYLMFLDADDRYAPNICEVLYDIIQKTESDIVLSGIKYIKNNQFEENVICPFNENSYEVVNPKENKNIFLRNYMWDKIYRIDFLKEFNIECPEGLLYEDLYFTVQCYLNTEKVIFLENFYGYEYNMRDDLDDLSLSNNLDILDYIGSIQPYYIICDFIREKGQPDLINWVLEEYFVRLIGTFSRLNADYETKITFLEELYKLYVYSEFSSTLNELWAEIIFRNITKRNFRMAIICSKIINILVNSYSLRKLYRRIYNKEYI